MPTIAKTVICLYFIFTCLYGNGQQPVLSVQSFEYIRDINPGDGKYWLSIPEASYIKDNIRKSFSTAVYQRWNIKMPDIALSVKAPSMFSYGPPKFNTRLKDKQPGTWYMFFQAYARNSDLAYANDNTKNISVTLGLKCRIIDGSSDSLILDRELTVRLYTPPPPPGQVVLTKLPGYPADFANAFDSIALWLFNPSDDDFKYLALKPACVFIESGITGKPVKELEYLSDEKGIQLINPPVFSFNTPGPNYTLIKNRKNIGGNAASGFLTLVTGVNFSKEKTKIYTADYPFVSGEDTIHCFVSFAEEESADRERVKEKYADGSQSSHLESGEYSFTSRHTDSGFFNMVISGNDTIATFTVSYLPKDQSNLYTKYWDGADSATIMQLPNEWNNHREDANVFVKGTTKEDSFFMQSSRERTVKNFFINGQPALTVYGKNLPVKALVFQQLSPELIQLFTILSSLPYAYFKTY